MRSATSPLRGMAAVPVRGSVDVPAGVVVRTPVLPVIDVDLMMSVSLMLSLGVTCVTETAEVPYGNRVTGNGRLRITDTGLSVTGSRDSA